MTKEQDKVHKRIEKGLKKISIDKPIVRNRTDNFSWVPVEGTAQDVKGEKF